MKTKKFLSIFVFCCVALAMLVSCGEVEPKEKSDGKVVLSIVASTETKGLGHSIDLSDFDTIYYKLTPKDASAYASSLEGILYSGPRDMSEPDFSAEIVLGYSDWKIETFAVDSDAGNTVYYGSKEITVSPSTRNYSAVIVDMRPILKKTTSTSYQDFEANGFAAFNFNGIDVTYSGVNPICIATAGEINYSWKLKESKDSNNVIISDSDLRNNFFSIYDYITSGSDNYVTTLSDIEGLVESAEGSMFGDLYSELAAGRSFAFFDCFDYDSDFDDFCSMLSMECADCIEREYTFEEALILYSMYKEEFSIYSANAIKGVYDFNEFYSDYYYETKETVLSAFKYQYEVDDFDEFLVEFLGYDYSTISDIKVCLDDVLFKNAYMYVPSGTYYLELTCDNAGSQPLTAGINITLYSSSFNEIAGSIDVVDAKVVDIQFSTVEIPSTWWSASSSGMMPFPMLMHFGALDNSGNGSFDLYFSIPFNTACIGLAAPGSYKLNTDGTYTVKADFASIPLISMILSPMSASTGIELGEVEWVLIPCGEDFDLYPINDFARELGLNLSSDEKLEGLVMECKAVTSIPTKFSEMYDAHDCYNFGDSCDALEFWGSLSVLEDMSEYHIVESTDGSICAFEKHTLNNSGVCEKCGALCDMHELADLGTSTWVSKAPSNRLEEECIYKEFPFVEFTVHDDQDYIDVLYSWRRDDYESFGQSEYNTTANYARFVYNQDTERYEFVLSGKDLVNAIFGNQGDLCAAYETSYCTDANGSLDSLVLSISIEEKDDYANAILNMEFPYGLSSSMYGGMCGPEFELTLHYTIPVEKLDHVHSYTFGETNLNQNHFFADLCGRSGDSLVLSLPNTSVKVNCDRNCRYTWENYSEVLAESKETWTTVSDNKAGFTEVARLEDGSISNYKVATGTEWYLVTAGTFLSYTDLASPSDFRPETVHIKFIEEEGKQYASVDWIASWFDEYDSQRVYNKSISVKYENFGFSPYYGPDYDSDSAIPALVYKGVRFHATGLDADGMEQHLTFVFTQEEDGSLRLLTQSFADQFADYNLAFQWYPETEDEYMNQYIEITDSIYYFFDSYHEWTIDFYTPCYSIPLALDYSDYWDGSRSSSGNGMTGVSYYAVPYFFDIGEFDEAYMVTPDQFDEFFARMTDAKKELGLYHVMRNFCDGDPSYCLGTCGIAAKYFCSLADIDYVDGMKIIADGYSKNYLGAGMGKCFVEFDDAKFYLTTASDITTDSDIICEFTVNGSVVIEQGYTGNKDSLKDFTISFGAGTVEFEDVVVAWGESQDSVIIGGQELPLNTYYIVMDMLQLIYPVLM